MTQVDTSWFGQREEASYEIRTWTVRSPWTRVSFTTVLMSAVTGPKVNDGARDKP